MLIRIWKVALAPGRGDALETFAREHSLPVFEAQDGCLGVIFSRSDSHCVTLTLWDDADSIARLERSRPYRDVVRRIESSGIIGDDHATEVLSVYGGFADSQLHGRLSQTSPPTRTRT